MKRREHSQTHFTRPALPCYQSQIRTLQENQGTDEYRCKSSQQNTTKLNSAAHYKDHTQ